MLCAISGEPPQEPVVSKLSGNVFEKRLIERYVTEHGVDPVSKEDMTIEDLLPLKTNRVVRPRPPTLTSIPALLASFQNEWDALATETYNLTEQLKKAREELSTALYQNDAAVRVIARLTQERDEARDALSKINVSVSNGPNAEGDAMAVDSEFLPDELVAIVDATQAQMSKSRKKRPIPEGWVTPEDISAFTVEEAKDLEIPQTKALAIDQEHAAIGGFNGLASCYSIATGEVERTMDIGPVTDAIWRDNKIIFATAKGMVLLFDKAAEVANFADHVGAITGIALHPSGDLLASVGVDKSFVIYDLKNLKRAMRVQTDSTLSSCAFHPDGHLLAVGTNSGVVKVFQIKTGEEAAKFELGARVESIAFSENGYWFAAASSQQTTVTIFDLRKEGDAARAKVLEIGAPVQSLAWDYSQQFLATAGPSGITVQQYSKSAKKWSEAVRKDFSAVRVAWGTEAKMLVAVSENGNIGILKQ
ncbi:WD40-repeat-containing domain protein [Pseudomassariella vexata]|uniref:Pre-mRNA-processing factor 19 n=1 Tax=Pseudomassariella vexata TaxID=1141098 RepID=A0A1Y2DVU9_9PEZI|nr:WD40-repeat-containing domain protein [Pseudomassariella vexata]ORY63266.1 WD40-repeat-containing domain protein [Pseudomassariella vexata]